MQGQINQVDSAVNAGLGQQALQLAATAQSSVDGLTQQLSDQADRVESAVGGLTQAGDAYRTAVPQVKETAQAIINQRPPSRPTWHSR